MIISPIANDTITVWKRSFGSPDRLGVRAVTGTPTDVPGCSFQAWTDTELDTDVDTTIAMWRLYAPPVEAILSLTAIDAIQVGAPFFPSVFLFEDFGDPQPFTDLFGNLDHVMILLRKARG